MIVLDSVLVKTFAGNLKALRLKARLSQEELALRAGLDRTYISGCERAIRNPSLLSVEKIAEALNATATDLLGDGNGL
jgi:transcriptional regulator with XRE-family HTH domain